MKSKKIPYPALALCILFFASCSMNKNNISSSKSDANKMQYAQQLEGQNVTSQQSSKDSHISTQINVQNNQAYASGNNFKPIQAPVLLKHKKSNPAIKLAMTYMHHPVLIASKAAVEIQKLRNAGTRTAAHKDLPFADANLLLMW